MGSKSGGKYSFVVPNIDKCIDIEFVYVWNLEVWDYLFSFVGENIT